MTDHHLGDVDACKTLWGEHLMVMVDDALGLFKVPTKGVLVKPIDVQYKKLHKKFSSKDHNIYRRAHLFDKPEKYRLACVARCFLENSHFDDVAYMIGYDSEFINRTFDYVQKSISLEKKLFEEFSKPDRRVLGDRRCRGAHFYIGDSQRLYKRRVRA